MRLYRGDTSRPERPELTAGTWLTDDAEVATWYGCAHQYDLRDDLKVLDLTDLGVGGVYGTDEDADAEYVERVEDALREAGIDPEPLFCGHTELYMMAEDRKFQEAARAAGYEAVRLMQWHADKDDEEYEAVLLLTDDV